MDALLPSGVVVLDPFAGVGRIHEIAHIHPICVEIEPEWATSGVIANALHLPFGDGVFEWICTSPTFGNRMADHHEAKDPCARCHGVGFTDAAETPCSLCGGSGLSKRHTYRHYLDRMPHRASSAILQWGKDYRDFHRLAWTEVTRVAASQAVFLLNISDHIRKGEVQPVTEWHHGVLVDLGWICTKEVPVRTRRQKHGQNGDLRVANETVLYFERID